MLPSLFFFYACIIPGILPSVCDFITFEKIAGPAAGSFRRAMIKRIRLLPEWNAFRPGVVVTGLGLAVLLAIGLVRWVMAGKPETRQAILQTQRDEQMEAANQRKAEAEERIRKAQGK